MKPWERNYTDKKDDQKKKPWERNYDLINKTSDLQEPTYPSNAQIETQQLETTSKNANLPSPVGQWGVGQPSQLRQVPITWGGRPVGSVTIPENGEDLRWSQLPGNIPGDLIRYLGDVGFGMSHPMKSAEALGGVLAGLAEKGIPGRQLSEDDFNVFLNDVKEKYGSVENLKRSMIENPVRTSADISTLLTPFGAAIKGVGLLGGSTRLAKYGGAVSKTGAFLEPTALIREASLGTIGKFGSKYAKKLYASAAKMSSRLGIKESERLAQIALENDIMPTIKGWMETDRIQRQLATEVENVLTRYQQANPLPTWQTSAGPIQAPIYLNDLFFDLDKLRTRASLTGNQGLIDRAMNKLIKGNMGRMDPARGKIVLTPQEVQRLKIDINAENQSFFKKQMERPFSKYTKAQIAKNASKFLEYLVPEIKQLNAKESEMIALRTAIEQSAQRIQKRDLMGISIPAKGATGQLIGAQAGAVVGLGLGLMDTPSVKARLASALHKLGKRGVKFTPKTAMVLDAFYQGDEQLWRLQQYYEERGIPLVEGKPIERYENLTDEDVRRIFGNQ